MRQTVIDLLEKVAAMRKAQTGYFKNGRQRDDLIRSKQLETEIDIEIPKLLTALKNKPDAKN